MILCSMIAALDRDAKQKPRNKKISTIMPDKVVNRACSSWELGCAKRVSSGEGQITFSIALNPLSWLKNSYPYSSTTRRVKLFFSVVRGKTATCLFLRRSKVWRWRSRLKTSITHHAYFQAPCPLSCWRDDYLKCIYYHAHADTTVLETSSSGHDEHRGQHRPLKCTGFPE